ncbi:methyltransferase domain-containing protein [Aliiglaciecola lipolytica]|uniref:Malonyl-[acyl-carrier protein] O-methyltransferase n=1 Tax=Aliiglaciecola lipolytica E3 TaxID=1127673 RepID=K6WWY7_9ALTE|nr:methyltransferase domain-containing protein [Aliiglaciecola lipolytica]GAC12959.1 malonyl-CoA O-methyltransferase [Aliiglaciecola lipolytica E3]
MSELVLDKKRRIAYQFSQSAHRYDNIAQVQLDIGFDAIQQVQPNATGKLLDIGCGTGRLTRMLAPKFQHTYGIDLAEGMINHAQQCIGQEHDQHNIDYRVADAEALPFLDNQFDTVFSCMALQWCSPISQSLQEAFRVLVEEGNAVIAILTDGSMAQLHATWQKIDSVPRVNHFISHQELVDAAQRIGFDVSHQQKSYTTWHKGAVELLNSIRHIGANVVSKTGNHARFARNTLAEFERAYQQDFAEQDLLPLTYNVSFLKLHKKRMK